jgi:hypothetical protein
VYLIPRQIIRDLGAFENHKPALSDEERRIRASFSSLTAPRDETSREVEEALIFLGRLTRTAFRHGIALDLPLPLESVWKAMVEEPTSEPNRLQEEGNFGVGILQGRKWHGVDWLFKLFKTRRVERLRFVPCSDCNFNDTSRRLVSMLPSLYR